MNIDMEEDEETSFFVGGRRQIPESRGRYFGICFSYHNSKACMCGTCPSYPENGKLMFCARGKSELPERLRKKAGCFCQECELYRKFGLEGTYFCF